MLRGGRAWKGLKGTDIIEIEVRLGPEPGDQTGGTTDPNMEISNTVRLDGEIGVEPAYRFCQLRQGANEVR